ncbi:MAG: MDR family oxidoreductase [Pseudomonadota bacterium]|jgi:acrylyl-CoA reductase (NADPH)|nr:MDR family oxidoreductase [Pseudomonadota bacterium]MEC9098118.1 MDR family oxidoreductase [Pseudomonadota bacterium]MED5253608.1 MDR family oxidoreductase [Pseudomonadota bacterium]MED5272931.1 MDR family oxidoreductase [Pseudomonadota bacterium]MED5483933.1 MDR family oxidoreductase [Pseudomonadota bacterium]|tara:strand:+ start:1809 stop:2801 length:993 start_codon:yes stop_codon:yes gene_type:complete
MSEKFRALMIEKEEDTQTVKMVDIEDNDLMEGNVLVNVTHSTLNYKDGLAITGASPVVRSFPMIPGIDFSGIVLSSEDNKFSEGDRVVLNGYGLSESHFGGYSEKARVKSEHLLKLPENISNKQAMAIGTAGYTAMLCVLAIEDHGINPDDGIILVSGASGGVGSVAISLLSDLGYNVEASTGRLEETPYLNTLGAKTVIDRSELSEPSRPLGKERWAGAIDSVGSTTLANILAQVSYGGAVSACGLAQGMDLPSTVMPFILRGVSLLGIDSVMAPMQLRERAWKRLSENININKLEEMTIDASLDQVEGLANEILQGKVRGRVIVNISE